MKRITDADVSAFIRKKRSTSRPAKTKVGIDGLERPVSGGFPITDESKDILRRATNSWMALRDFRKQADRCVRFYEGDQWSDKIEVRDRLGRVTTMTEEEYIKSQGRAALKLNIIHTTIINVVGQYISAPYTSIIYSSDEGGQEAADMMSVKLDDVKRINDSEVRDARALETNLNTGSAIYITSCPWNETLREPIPTFRAIDYHRYFRTVTANDVAGQDVDFCGDFIDIPLEEAISIYAKNEAQKNALEQIYGSRQRYAEGDIAFYPKGIEVQSFIDVPPEGYCRIIRICQLELRQKVAVHDYSDASWETYDVKNNIIANLDNEIARRKEMAAQAGLDYYDPANRMLLEYEKTYTREWVYYHMSPWGNVLWSQENPYQHNSHNYVELFYPLLNGHVHGMAYDLLDVEKMLNRMFIMNDFIMSASAKGVLIVDENAISDDFDLEDIAEEWSKFNGVIKVKLKDGARAPEQVVSRQINVGQYDMINLMLGMVKDISGVHDAAQGKTPNSGTPAALYRQEVNNSQINTLDYLNAFSWFIEQRDYKLIQLIQQFCRQAEYIATGNGAPVHFDPEVIRKFKLRNKVTKSSATAVARLFNEQLMAQMLANGMASLQQYQNSGAKPFGTDLLAKLEQMQDQLANGQGVSDQQIASLQQSIPSTPQGMMQAARIAGYNNTAA